MSEHARILTNYCPEWQDEFMDTLLGANYPILDETKNTNWQNQNPFWADFRPRANLGFLRNITKINSPIIEKGISEFIGLANFYKFPVRMNRLVMTQCWENVQPHTDMPYRTEALNWHLTDTHGSEITIGDQKLYPRKGDLIYMDVSITHSLINTSGITTYLMAI